ncbi:MAG: hypothetical protein AAF441_09920 [Pseudomonadota bacterium]
MANRALTALTAAIAFTAVAADANAAARTFNKPHVDGDRIASCTSDGQTCGKAVADYLCTSQGYQRALTFRVDRRADVGARLVTVDSKVVSADTHNAFDFVKCYKPNNQPTTVTFTQPKSSGAAEAFRLANAECGEGDDHCTRDAADAWCRQRGFSLGARTYAIKLDLGLDNGTLFGAGSSEEVEIQSSFASISCKAL